MEKALQQINRLSNYAREALASPLVVGAAAGAGIVVLDRATRRLRHQPNLAVAIGVTCALVRSGQIRTERQVRNCEDVAPVLAAIGPFAPPFGNWRIEADFGRLIVDELQNRPQTVVECGSGLTSLLVASLLRANGTGKLYSLEHDRDFAALTQEAIDRAGLTEWVCVIHAPLALQEIGPVTVSWYEPSSLVHLPATIELLLIDGPPAALGPLARWPAVPLLHDRLASGAVVLCDDGRDRYMAQTVRRWQRDLSDLTCFWHDTVKGTWRLEKTQQTRRDGRLVRGLRSARRTLLPHPTGFGRAAVRW